MAVRMVLDEIYRQVYGSSQEGVVYYDPWTGTRNHFFLQLPPGQNQLSLPELAGMCRAAFLPDQSHENPYTCSLFYQKLGGYVRFNYANRQEVAVFYEQGAQQAVTVMKQWLLSKGCRGEV
ncbi:hypothetical protein JCM10914_2422 [Paenibacillus sp. JCM 10914]|nr:hypothetical protein JCM10914_2422 [Paenibacillus sp. JCM 10914]